MSQRVSLGPILARLLGRRDGALALGIAEHSFAPPDSARPWVVADACPYLANRTRD